MRIHFIAIGGSAMHNLALALHGKGHFISGSDDAIHEPSKSRLQARGLLPEKTGWFPEKITPDIDAVILGMHAKKDNPELLKARELAIRIYSYPEFIYEQSKDKIRVVIGGSHGKTTITSMVLHVLKQQGIAVDYMVGAQLEGFDTMVHLTDTNKYIVLEGDEYLSSALDRRPKFHLYKPHIALLSGIAWDHINVFPRFEDYVRQFAIFIDSIEPEGTLVYCATDPLVKKIAEQSTRNIVKIPYTTYPNRIQDRRTYLLYDKREYPVNIFGAHNMQNLSGAQKVCALMGISEAEFITAISGFKGAHKRLEKLAENAHSVLYKDFAHSPSKVKATVHAVRELYPDKKIIACLELHTYSSLNATFLKDYRHTLDQADQAVVFYTPEAVAIKGLKEVSALQIKEAFKNDKLNVYTKPSEFKEFLDKQVYDNTVLLLMSSGNYGGLDLKELARFFSE